MQVNHMLLRFFLWFSTLYAAEISDIVAGNEALTKVALDADIFLVALTPQSGFGAAQKVTRSLHNLTTSVATSIANDTATYTPTTFDPNIEDTITSSYGLLTNTVEEFMFDLFYQEQVLKSYSQQHGIYRNLLHLNSTFARYGTYIHSVVGDIYHQNITRNETANAARGIVNATEKYAPVPTGSFFSA